MKAGFDICKVYHENAARGATPIGLVVVLYDVVIEDMRRALDAMKRGEIEARSAAVHHAFLVLQQLQGTLDFERGGAPARQFEQFYNLTRAKLLEAQMRNSLELMQQQVQFMSEVRDCWMQAEKQMHPQPASGSRVIAQAVHPEIGPGGGTTKWSA